MDIAADLIGDPHADCLTIPALMPEQDIAHAKMFGKRYFALFPDLGTGKTFMIIREFLAAWQAGLCDGLAIIAPPDVHAQWLDEEWPKISRIPCVSAAWPELPPLAPSNLPRVFSIYPEAFRRDRKKGTTPEEKLALREHRRKRRAKGKLDSTDVWRLLGKFLQSGRMGLVIDESQMLGHASSNTTRRIKGLKKLAAYRRVASGFPAPKKIQFYPQYSFLSTNILKCQTKGSFMDKFCVMGGFKAKQIVDYKNEEEFNSLVAPYTYTVRIEDCMRMPRITRLIHPCSLTDVQRRLIEEIKRDFRASLDDDTTMVMPMALQRLTRIQQIACGFLPKLDDQGKATGELRWLPENRTAALETLLDGIRGKVLIWSHFKPCINRLVEHFGDSALAYQGGMSREEKIDNKNRFMRDPRITHLFAQPKNAGAGLNGLTVARHSVYWSNAQDAQRRRQTERRIWRPGARLDRACVYVDLDAKGTYDRKIRDAVVNQLDVATSILRDIASWRK